MSGAKVRAGKLRRSGRRLSISDPRCSCLVILDLVELGLRLVGRNSVVVVVTLINVRTLVRSIYSV